MVPTFRPLLLALALLPCAAAQSRLYVDASRTTSGAGTSWATAKRTVQEALAIATSGSEVWVAFGSYAGGFNVPAGVTLYGGFLAGSNRLTQRDGFLNRTTLNGNFTQRVLALGANAVVDGFFVQSGSAGAPGGAGALVDGINATIRNCVFRSHVNTAGRGAAIFVRNGTLLLENSLVYFNGGPGSGTAMEMENAGGLILNSLFHDNENGGLRFGAGSRPTVLNTIFAVNLGRGVWHEGPNDTPTFQNCLFFDNRLSGVPANYYNQGTTLNTAAEINSLPFASNTLVADPRWASVAANDYHLLPTSPCIDAGTTAFAMPAQVRDYYGNSRRLDGNLDGTMLLDIGPHEFANVTFSITVHIGHGHVHPTIGGTAGLPAILMLATSLIPPTLVDPFGYFWLNPSPLFVMSPGPIPQFLTFDIPPTVPIGTVLYWQALTVGGTGGVNLSGLGDSEVQ